MIMKSIIENHTFYNAIDKDAILKCIHLGIN
jgi:hypothetical protein